MTYREAVCRISKSHFKLSKVIEIGESITNTLADVETHACVHSMLAIFKKQTRSCLRTKYQNVFLKVVADSVSMNYDYLFKLDFSFNMAFEPRNGHFDKRLDRLISVCKHRSVSSVSQR